MAVITEKQRKVLARAGVAMPDGSYYIRNAKELDDAIHAVGRGDASHDVIRKHIIKRAGDLNLSNAIPDNWNSDGSLKNASSSVGHSGAKGLHWGIDNQRELEIYIRVAEGRGIMHEHTAVRSCMTAITAARHKGSVESFSREQALRLQTQKQRIQAGQGSEYDRLDLLGLGDTALDDPVRKLAVKPAGENVPAIHSSTTEEEFFQHFGVKGMHWGVRRSASQLLEKADKHEKTLAIHGHLAQEYGRQHQEIQQKGIYSKAFKTVYGDKAPLMNEGLFRLTTGRSKAQALEEVNQTIQSLHNSHARSANRHSKKAAKLREKAKTATHDGFVTGFTDEDDFLEHFGVKGMHWGVRRSGASSSVGRASTGSRTPIRPRQPQVHQSAEQRLVGKAMVEAYMRKTGPELARYALKAPPKEARRSNDPQVQALLNRAHQQGANRVEAQAGADFLRRLPPGVKLQ